MLDTSNKLLLILEGKMKEYSNECNMTLGDSSFLLALSGGVDSIVLSKLMLELRNKYRFRFAFAHINHHAHYRSDEVEKFCFQYSYKNNVEFNRCDFFKSTGKNFESESRNKRYSFFIKVAKKKSYRFILTAHHQDDQLETLYMKLEDNGDWISRIGIRERIKSIRRPFLDIDKKEIQEYARLKGLAWIDDPSNTDLSLRRNKIRHAILPEAMKADGGLKQRLLNTAKWNFHKLRYTEFNLKKDQKYIIKEKSSNYILIDRKVLIGYNLEQLKLFVYISVGSLFKITIQQQSGGLWREFNNFINKSCTGSMFQIDITTFIVNRDQIIVINDFNKLDIPPKLRICHNLLWFSGKFKTRNNSRLNLQSPKDKFALPYSIYKNGIYTRKWNYGDKILSSTTHQHVAISDLYINNKLSKYEKYMQPVVVDNNDSILWIPSLMHGKFNYGYHGKEKIISWASH